jgi:hypothetical protein
MLQYCLEIQKNKKINREAALTVARAGMPVFPVRAQKMFLSNGRYRLTPVSALGPYTATKNLDSLDDWRWSRSIPAIPCTEIVVVHAHRFREGVDGVAVLEALIGDQEWPSPPVVLTPDGGKHHYFLQPQDPLDSFGCVPEGIRIEGLGSFVAAPGAVTLDGACWQVDDSVPSNDIPELPSWLERIIRSPAD